MDAQLWTELKASLASALSGGRAGVTTPVGTRVSTSAVWPDVRTAAGNALPDVSATADSLTAVPTKTTSAPSTSQTAAPQLTYDDTTATLRWRHVLPGDYDQNGEVNAADLAPLATNMGVRADDLEAGFPHDTHLSAIDGDANGEINAADIVTIAANFRLRVEGYRVYTGPAAAYPTAPDAPNGAAAQLAGTVPLTAATSAPGQRLALEFTLAAPGGSAWVRGFHGAADGTPSNAVQTQAPVNQPPDAKLVAGPTGGATPLQVTLNATQSSDPDGQIVRYEWDLNGDGFFEYDSGSNAVIPYWFYAPGEFTLGVRVTDDAGASDSATAGVSVAEGAKWHVQEVDDYYRSPREIHIVEAAGNPALFYEWQDPDSLVVEIRYRRALDQQATTWDSPVTLHDNVLTYWPVMVGGTPAIVQEHIAPPARLLGFRSALNQTGSAWDALQIGPELPGQGSAIYATLVQGRPAAAIVHGARLYYSLADDPAGSGWGELLELGILAAEADLQVIAGRPAVAYRRTGGHDDLIYVAAEDAEGSAWRFPVVVESEGASGFACALLELQGLPAILYIDQTFEALKLVRALDAFGAEWDEPRILDIKVSALVGACVQPDGRAAASYATRDGAELLFIAANDTRGDSWTRPLTVFNDVWDRRAGDLKMAGGQLAVAFAVEAEPKVIAGTYH